MMMCMLVELHLSDREIWTSHGSKVYSLVRMRPWRITSEVLRTEYASDQKDPSWSDGSYGGSCGAFGISASNTIDMRTMQINERKTRLNEESDPVGSKSPASWQ